MRRQRIGRAQACVAGVYFLDATGGLRLALTLVCALCVVATALATHVDECRADS